VTLPPLHLFRTFEVAARAASFSMASRELGMSQAAVSQQIRQLETWLGRRLFLREGRGVRLGPAGEELQEAVAAGLGLIGRAAGRLRRSASADLTIACLPSIALRWLIPNLASFQALYPSAGVRLLYARAHQPFDPEDVDILITLGAPDPHGARSVPLFSRRNRPVASALLVEHHPELLELSGLTAANLLHDDSTKGWAAWFARAGVARPGPLRGPVFQDFHLLSTAVLAGQGVALCPVEVFRQEIARGELVVLSGIETDEDQTYLMTHDIAAPPAVLAFADWFAGVCRMPG
jgi:DNA-binding transcriptional LysR family regulator